MLPSATDPAYESLISITHAGAAASCTTASSPANSYSSARGRREHSPLDAVACRLERARRLERAVAAALTEQQSRPDLAVGQN